jgi:hypothetical protein
MQAPVRPGGGHHAIAQFPSGAEQAAEKGQKGSKNTEFISQGLKPTLILRYLRHD